MPPATGAPGQNRWTEEQQSSLPLVDSIRVSGFGRASHKEIEALIQLCIGLIELVRTSPVDPWTSVVNFIAFIWTVLLWASGS
jgi:hypothetical protein